MTFKKPFIESFKKYYDRFNFLLIIPMMILFMSNFIIILLADVGLAYTQNTLPNAFHGKFLNYDNLWAFLDWWFFMSFAFCIIGFISLQRRFNRKLERTFPLGYKKPKKSLKELFR